jgi:hypothetical protein
VNQRSEWLLEFSAALHGPRRARRRLVSELSSHVDDAVAAELADGLAPQQAEAAALARIGSPRELALRWSTEASDRRKAGRVRTLVFALVVAAVLAPVGLAQRSGAHSHGTPQGPAPRHLLRPGP